MLLLLPPLLLIMADGALLPLWFRWIESPPPELGSGSPSFCAAAIASTFERFRLRFPSELGCAPASKSNEGPAPEAGRWFCKAAVEDWANGAAGKTNGESNGGFGVP